MKGTRPITIMMLMGMVTVGVLLAFQVYAQATGLTISPLTFELTANPGDELVNKIRVYNPTESTVIVKMEVEDFTAVGETGQVRIEEEPTETYSLVKWVSAVPEEFTLGPQEQRFVDFIIAVPQDAEPGGHYGSVLATTGGVIGPGITGAAVTQKVGALILLSVSGEVEENLIVKEFSAPRFSEFGPIPFVLRFENKGTVHVRLKGFVTIANWRGKKVADVEVPQRNVIPGAVRKMDTSWNEKWLWGGRYIATLVGSYGTQNNPVTPATITFWAFPWKVGVGILVVLILFVLSRRRWLTALKILFRGEKALRYK